MAVTQNADVSKLLAAKDAAIDALTSQLSMEQQDVMNKTGEMISLRLELNTLRLELNKSEQQLAAVTAKPASRSIGTCTSKKRRSVSSQAECSNISGLSANLGPAGIDQELMYLASFAGPNDDGDNAMDELRALESCFKKQFFELSGLIDAVIDHCQVENISALDVARAGDVEYAIDQWALTRASLPVLREMLQSIENMVCSTVLADPDMKDCPLVTCSAGFEAITGYTKSEIIGRNCRFLNERTTDMGADLKAEMRDSIENGIAFTGILPNQRKDGEMFWNLLHMETVFLREKRYIIGVQSDISDIDLDLANIDQLAALQNIWSEITTANIEIWARIHPGTSLWNAPAIGG